MLDSAVSLHRVTVVLKICGNFDRLAWDFDQTPVRVASSCIVEDRFTAYCVKRWVVDWTLLLFERKGRFWSQCCWKSLGTHASTKVHRLRSLINGVALSERDDSWCSHDVLGLPIGLVADIFFVWALSPSEIFGLGVVGKHCYEEWWNDSNWRRLYWNKF